MKQGDELLFELQVAQYVREQLYMVYLFTGCWRFGSIPLLSDTHKSKYAILQTSPLACFMLEANSNN